MELKTRLVNACIDMLNQKKNHFETEIKETQFEANQFKGAMESRYDTFKEELQERKNSLILQLNKLDELLLVINTIQIQKHYRIGLGSIVKALDEKGNTYHYFIFANISSKPINIDGDDYYMLNLESPLGNELNSKITNETVNFREKVLKIIHIL